MIIGLGTDIVENIRIERAVLRWGDKFLKRVYTEKETFYCYQRKNPYIHFSGRFAAKEATIKAFTNATNRLFSKDDFINISKLKDLSSFISKPLSLKDIEISNDEYNSPQIHITAILPYNQKKFLRAFLSISHEKNYSIATVILELKDSYIKPV